MLALGVTAFLTAPFPFLGSDTRFWWGIPVWLWWSMGWTVGLSVLTAWGILRYWKDDPADGA